LEPAPIQPEPAVVTPPVPEPITEPAVVEETPTAQPVEPLDPEPNPTPVPAPDSNQVPESVPELYIAPIEPSPTPESAQLPPTPTEPIPEPVSTPSTSSPQETPTPTPEPVSAPQPQVSTPPVIQTSLARELLIKAREVIQFRKRKKLEKIMGMFLKQANITNDDVEKLLHVSDATATRYLEQLERGGKVRQNGRTGKPVSYSRM
ncbi:MAG: hypothetical protein UY47_C0002G0040, partial [Parcubacteria group bacterium GW2011_GWB1_49_7]